VFHRLLRCTSHKRLDTVTAKPVVEILAQLPEDGTAELTRIRGNGIHRKADNPLETADTMFFQPDGNLAIYGPYGETLWSANTQNAPIYS
jgi:hypothetical protein